MKDSIIKWTARIILLEIPPAIITFMLLAGTKARIEGFGYEYGTMPLWDWGLFFMINGIMAVVAVVMVILVLLFIVAKEGSDAFKEEEDE